MHRLGTVPALVAALIAAVLLAGCGGRSPARASIATAPTSIAAASASSNAFPAPFTTAAARPTRSMTIRPAATRASSVHSAARATTRRRTFLPRGGRKIIGHYRVVAYYGTAGTSALGVLGSAAPERVAPAIEQRAAGFAPYGLPVQPAMELIATVAQGAPGRDGTYSRAIPLPVIEHYLAVAHAHKMLLILDLQPGRASFLQQAEALRTVLLDPSVSIALDSEWKVGPHGRPGNGLIGTSPAAGINAVTRYISGLVRAYDLPDKLVVVHEFTLSMLPDRARIAGAPGAEVTFHADGFGTQAVKTHVYGQLRFPGRPFGAGFKLFLRQDRGLMTPAAVMALRPRPDVITYQ